MYNRRIYMYNRRVYIYDIRVYITIPFWTNSFHISPSWTSR